MGKGSEVKLNRTLALLRRYTDKSTLRRLPDGRLVADIVPPSDLRSWSLNRFLADATAEFSSGTFSNYIAELVEAGFVAAGTPGRPKKRWVVMEGEFRYPDSNG